MIEQHIQTIRDAADQCRLVRIQYLKPGAAETTERLFEPYRLSQAGSAIIVAGFQIEPEPLGDTSWRNFRIDRIASAEPTDQTFQPRVNIDLDSEPEPFIYGYTPTDEQTPAQTYFATLENAVLAEDDQAAAAFTEAQTLASRLGPAKVRTVHARLYRDVIDALLIDGDIDDDDAAYLDRIASLLKQLGWSPTG